MGWSPDPAWIALIGTLGGTVGLRVAAHYLERGRGKIDDAAQIRSELRDEIASNKTEMKALEEELEKYKNLYYDLRDKYIGVQTELTLTLQRVKDEDSRKALEEATRHAMENLPPRPE